MHDASAIIAAILGAPPKNNPPSFVQNVQARRAALERGARMVYRPFTNIRATPGISPPVPVSRVAAGCKVCGLPKPCCCPTR